MNYFTDIEGALVRMHWNYRKKLYSVSTKREDGSWKVLRDGRGIQIFAGKIVLKDVEFRVSAAGKARVRESSQRNVHAYIQGELLYAYEHVEKPVVPCGRTIFYSPFAYEEPTFMYSLGQGIVYPVYACGYLSAGVVDNKAIMLGVC